MPIRFVISQLHRLALIIAVSLGPVAVAQASESVALSLEDARAIAVEALKQNDPGTAIRLANGLLQADPNDFVAHYILATAYSYLDRPKTSRKSAARAYRLGESKTARFNSAQLAARMAFSEKRYSLSQFWLRRAAIHAPNDQSKSVVARDYEVLRRINPWAFRVQVDLRPSSNVNKGSDTALQIIDGVPVTGTLSGSARALSGLIGSLDVAASYRLTQSETSATSLRGRLYAQRVALSSEAKALAPRASNSDFASTYAEATLRHDFAVGPAEKRGVASVDASLGEAWYGGDRSFRFTRISADRTWRLQGGSRLRMDAILENRFMAASPVNDARVLGLGGDWRRPLANGDAITLSFALRDSDAQHPNGTFWSGSFRTEYEWSKPIGPVRLSAGLILGYSNYPDFLSAGFIRVPGGRQDQSIYGDVSMMFHKLEYAGFAPMLRLRAGQKESNDSRYNMNEVSLSLGFQSKF